MAMVLFKVVLPFIAAAILLLVRQLVKPPPEVWEREFAIGWVAGIINLAADAVAGPAGFWHYTMPGLVLGLPLDFYITVSLIYGSAVLLAYWWLRGKNPRYALILAAVLPLYGLARDTLGTAIVGNLFLTWDSPYWWAADIAAWAAGLWTTLFVFEMSLRRSKFRTEG
jgi:hypothetical protein